MRLRNRVKAVAMGASLLAVLVACLVLLKVAGDPASAGASLELALGILLCAGALLALVRDDRLGLRPIPVLCGGALASLGLAGLAQHLLALDLGLDEMAPGAGASLLLVGLAVALLDAPSRSARLLAHAAALGAVASGGIAAIGHLYDAQLLSSAAPYHPMAPHTAVALAAVGVGILASRPDRGLVRHWLDPGPGGMLFRRILPWLVLVPVLLGWLRLAGERAGLYPTAVGTAVFATATVLLLVLVLWRNAVLLLAVDSARERAEREQEEWLHVTLSSIGDAVIATDTGGRVVFVNPVAEQLTGWSAEEARGQPVSEVLRLVSGASGRVVAGPLSRVVEEGVVATFGPDLLLARRDGTLLPVEDSAAPILAADGRLLGAVMVFHDVSERRRSEREVQEQRERLAAAIEAADAGTFRWRIEEDRMDWDASRARLFGLAEPGEVDTLDAFLRRVREEDRPTVRAAYEGCGRTGAVVDVEYRVSSPGGDRWIADRARRRQGEQGLSYLIGACTDVTERKRHEAALQEADRRKDEFLAILGHELRNPLAAISAGLRIAQGGASEGDRLWARDVVKEQVAVLGRLVDDLLDVSRITRGHLELRREPVSVSQLLNRAVDAARDEVAARGHRVRIEAPRDLHVEADATRLQQVVANLVVNAARYTPEPGEVRVTATEEDGEVEIAVHDTGAGLHADDLQRLFQPFARADRSHGGLGLGLALVRQLVELHGGRVEARSPGPGLGSTFVVRLPRGRGEGAPVEMPDTEVRSLPHHVLVVDDNQASARLLALLLAEAGHRVRVAADGAQALDLAEKEAPEVVFLDLSMPRMDGYEVARRLRARPGGDKLRIFALTGYGDDLARQRTRDAGFDGHLLKGTSLDETMEIVRALG